MCKVPKTKWPVSAIVSAIWIESMSRISPMSSTSGSSRRADRRARLNEGTVQSDLTLGDGGHPVVVHVFHGVLDREDVRRTSLVDLVDD